MSGLEIWGGGGGGGEVVGGGGVSTFLSTQEYKWEPGDFQGSLT